MHDPRDLLIAPGEMGEREPSRPRVLLIDDSELVHRLLRARLRFERIDISCASTGREGLECARRLGPDVILLDIVLPDTDGYTVIQELKSDPITRDVPVLFVSSHTETSVKVRAFELGAVDFIPKPFEVAELRARVRFAIQQHRLIKMLAQRAQLDAVTGLWNRAYFNQRLAEEVATATRHHRPISLVMLDLDHFKSVNDRFGHPFGDRVLDDTARLLTRARAGDIACRYGGEEFAIILPSTTVEEAAIRAERLRAALHEMQWDAHPSFALSASFGVASDASIDLLTCERLIEAADEAMYLAKRQGRNRVVVAPEPPVKLSKSA